MKKPARHLGKPLAILKVATLAFAFTFTFVLAGCGGGGGGGSATSPAPVTGPDLVVDFSYQTVFGYLWRPSTLLPTLTGLQGHAPNCVVSGGALPQGMVLDAASCSVSGTALEYGDFTPVITLTVPGYRGQITKTALLRIYGPPVTYPDINDAARFRISDSYTLNAGNINASLINNWTPVAGESVSYSMASGSLPAGLSLNTVNGAITGIATTPGTATFTVRAAVSRPGSAVLSAVSAPLFMNISTPISLSYFDGYPSVGAAFSAAPQIYSFGEPWTGATYQYSLSTAGGLLGVLPAGLSLDPLTGVISGAATAASGPAGAGFYGIAVLVTRNGASFTLRSSIRLFVS